MLDQNAINGIQCNYMSAEDIFVIVEFVGNTMHRWNGPLEGAVHNVSIATLNIMFRAFSHLVDFQMN